MLRKINNIWATAWQNKQKDLCTQQRLRSAWTSAQSDHSLCCALNGWLRTQGFFKRTAKTLIRLGTCQGWSESLLGAYNFFGFSMRWLIYYQRTSGPENAHLTPDPCMHHYYSDSTLLEPPPDKTNKMICAPSEDSDQPGHLPSLIRVFAVCMKKAWVLSFPLSAQGRP